MNLNELNIGLDFHQNGKIKKALKIYLTIEKKVKDNFKLYFLIGTAYLQLNESYKAIKFLQSSIKLNSYFVNSHKNLGLAHLKVKNFSKAQSSFDKAKVISPNDDDLYLKYGNLFREIKKKTEAINAYLKSLQINKENFYALYNLGIIYLEQKDFQNAKKNFYDALKINSSIAEFYYQLGRAHFFCGEIENMILCFRSCLKIDKNFAKVYNDLGYFYLNKNFNFDLARKNFEKLKKISPDYEYVDGNILKCKIQMCDWTSYNEDLKNILNQKGLNDKKITPFDSLLLCDDQNINFQIAKKYCSRKYKNIKKKIELKKNSKKISVGYFSSDFRNHAITHLTSGIFEYHDNKKFNIYGFNIGSFQDDQYTKKISKYFTKFFQINNKTDTEIINICSSLELDIAIDLNGHTVGHRMDLFSKGVAKVQINYLGYPGTTGANFYDYIIADKYIIPEKFKKFYSEKILYLPKCYQPNSLTNSFSKNVDRCKDYFSLPDDKFIFCNMNQHKKITPIMFSAWMKILKKSENSILCLLVTNNDAKRNLLLQTEKHGVSPSRIFFADKCDRELFYERLSSCDLFLDTFPYNAHTTASDSIKCGLPILTYSGKSFASRVCGSIIKAVGCDELVTDNLKDYIATAVELSKNETKIKKIKDKIFNEINKNSFFKAEVITKDLEDIYSSIAN